jgi:hypothetical protein
VIAVVHLLQGLAAMDAEHEPDMVNVFRESPDSLARTRVRDVGPILDL